MTVPPSRHTRLRGLAVQTPTVVMAHPDTGHQVEIVGVIHLAAATTWPRLAAHLTARIDTGWTVHTEGVRLATDAEIAAAGPAAFERVEPLREALQYGQYLETVTGLTHQRALAYPDQVRRVDFDDLRLADAFGPVGVQQFTAPLRQALTAENLPDPAQTAAVLHRWRHLARYVGLPVLAAASVLSRGRKSQELRDWKTVTDRVVLRARNAYAIAEARTEKAPVVLVWGAAHVPGMVALLTGHGYQVRSTTWRTMLRVTDLFEAPPTTTTAAGAEQASPGEVATVGVVA